MSKKAVTYLRRSLLLRKRLCTLLPDMEASPLTRQTRPDSFQPKIVQLYKELFNVRCPLPIIDCPSPTCRVESHIYQVRDHVQLSEGFWLEFFLLPPDKVLLQQVLDALTADDVLQIQVRLGQSNPLHRIFLIFIISCTGAHSVVLRACHRRSPEWTRTTQSECY